MRLTPRYSIGWALSVYGLLENCTNFCAHIRGVFRLLFASVLVILAWSAYCMGGVIPSFGAEGLILPSRFSGVLELTLVWSAPAVAGESPVGPDG